MRAFARSVAWLLLPALTGLVAVCPPAAAHRGRPKFSPLAFPTNVRRTSRLPGGTAEAPACRIASGSCC